MPKADPIITIRYCLEASLDRSGGAREEVFFRQALAALEMLAEENRDRPWVGDGPTPEEAGGESILVRGGVDGDLHRSKYVKGIGWTGMVLEPTGWRPMPKE